jgi:hypothetical protein
MKYYCSERLTCPTCTKLLLTAVFCLKGGFSQHATKSPSPLSAAELKNFGGKGQECENKVDHLGWASPHAAFRLSKASPYLATLAAWFERIEWSTRAGQVQVSCLPGLRSTLPWLWWCAAITSARASVHHDVFRYAYLDPKPFYWTPLH